MSCACVGRSIGRLVELAIKRRSGGELQAMATPLSKSDIQYVSPSMDREVPLAMRADAHTRSSVCL